MLDEGEPSRLRGRGGLACRFVECRVPVIIFQPFLEGRVPCLDVRWPVAISERIECIVVLSCHCGKATAAHVSTVAFFETMRRDKAGQSQSILGSLARLARPGPG